MKHEGCLLGGAVGDALGYEVEFTSEAAIFGHYGKGGIEEYVLHGGVAPVSDDTQMTLFTANGLLLGEEAGLKDDPAPWKDHIRDAYEDWLRTQQSGDGKKSWLNNVPELNHRRAPGNTCLVYLQPGKQGSVSGVRNNSKGCGGIMRVAPIGLYFDAGTEEERRRVDMLGAEAAAITHGHELGYIPAAFLVHMIQVLAHSEQATVQDALDGARSAVRTLFPHAVHLEALLNLLDAAESLAAQPEIPELDAIHQLGEGWVAEETLAIAVYCALRHEHDFERAVVAAVNHQGDSDSTGAVTGNILGARLGVSAIPAKFLRDLEIRDVIQEIADDLYDGKENAPSWKEKYILHTYSGKEASAPAAPASAASSRAGSKKPATSGDAAAGKASGPKSPSKEDCQRIAKETVKICQRGSYEKDGRTVCLPAEHSAKAVEIILDTPDDPDPVPPKQDGTAPRYVLTNLDSFAAAQAYLDDPASAAVHNYACASHPGGGFLCGSRAQEESLCRESTLYESISSPNTKMYYDRNRSMQGTFYPDDMLWSPYVVVFRDGEQNLLETPFVTTVFTLAAPNKGGRAKHAPQAEIDRHMERRLANMFDAAVKRGIRSLVLGAWGCGAFRHDPKAVAALLHEILVGNGWDRCFDNIILAVREAEDDPNYTAFRDAFRKELAASQQAGTKKTSAGGTDSRR